MKGGEDHFCFEIHESLGSVSEIHESRGSVLKFMKGGVVSEIHEVRGGSIMGLKIRTTS